MKKHNILLIAFVAVVSTAAYLLADPNTPQPAQQDTLRSMMGLPKPDPTFCPNFTNSIVDPNNNTTAAYFNTNHVFVQKDSVTNTSHTFTTNDSTQTLTNKSLTSPTITTATFSGTQIGTYTLGGTPTITAPAISSPTISGNPVNSYETFTASSGANVSLNASQSGGTFLFDRASGVNYTLPAPTVGVFYHFLTTVKITSNSAEVQTNTGTVFLEGALGMTGVTSTPGFAANASATLAIKSSGTTTGGDIGGYFTVTCIDSTHWMVTGFVAGSGTAATPFTNTP
jgi:hypothetical protein